MIDRHTKILGIVSKHSRVEVSKLAELLKVSKVTIRKDLNYLEEQGLINREHGYAVSGSGEDINSRLAYHYEVKGQIARDAAAGVKNGETVMIESGSCCARLADELSRNKRNITIVTNSAFIAGYIRRSPYAKIVLLGGDYQPESQVMVGPMTRKCASEFYVDKLFVGTDGFAETSGFTGNDYMRVETVRDLAKQAGHVAVLTDSSKFSHQGSVSLLKVPEVADVYTDDRIPSAAERFLIKSGVKVHKVPAEKE